MAKAKALKKGLDKISKKMNTLKLKAKSVDPFTYPDVRKKAATKLRVKQKIKKLNNDSLPPKVKLAKNVAKGAGIAAAGAAAATAYEGGGSRIKKYKTKYKPKGVGKALRGFGKGLK